MGQKTKNVRSRDQFKKYETETETLKIGLETGLETFITGIIIHK